MPSATVCERRAHRRRRRRLAAVIAMTIPRTDEPDESALSDWAAEEAGLAGDPLIRG